MNTQLQQAFDKIHAQVVEKTKANPHLINLVMNQATIITKLLAFQQLPEWEDMEKKYDVEGGLRKVMEEVGTLAYIAGSCCHPRVDPEAVNKIIEEVDKLLIPLLQLQAATPESMSNADAGIIVRPS